MQQINKINKKIVPAILYLTLIAGTLDIITALIDFSLSTGKNPAIVLQYIASAIVGRSAYAGGTDVVLVGLFFHYLIAFLFTFLFVFLFIKNKWVSHNKMVIGVLYGLFVWAVMNLIVVPFSQAAMPLNFYKALKAMLILIVMVGLPLAFLTPRFLKNKAGNF